MRKIEYWLLGAVMLLIGGLVALGVMAPAHRPLPVVPTAVAQQGDTAGNVERAEPDEGTSSTADVHSTVRRSSNPPPVRDLDAVKQHIADFSGSTFITEMLQSQGGTLYRWPARGTERLRVWIQPEPHVADWWGGYVQNARDAFAEWEMAGLPFRFEFPTDSAGADIAITWMDRFPPGAAQIGRTRRVSDRYAWVVRADILIALHRSDGGALLPNEVTADLRHEVGHALGLGHSANKETIMFPENYTLEITQLDRETLRLLYSLPPGPVR